jgi:hypothetical protein
MMNEKVFEKTEEVKIYGKGPLGVKGIGLFETNESPFPYIHRLSTRNLNWF